MIDHTNIPGELTEQDIKALAEQFRQMTLPDGRKPFTVAVNPRTAHYEIYLQNEFGTGVLCFRKDPKWKEEK